MPHLSHSSIQNTAKYKQLLVSVELQHCDVTSCSLVERLRGCGGTWELHGQAKLRGGAEKALARPGRKQAATTTKSGFIQHTSHKAQ